jgi:hypothetical protein
MESVAKAELNLSAVEQFQVLGAPVQHPLIPPLSPLTTVPNLLALIVKVVASIKKAR